MESDWISALIVAGYAAAAGAAAAGIAHDVKGFIDGKTPWDNPSDWVKGHYTAGGLGAAGGFVGGAAGAALGPVLGSTAGTMSGVVSGSSSTAPAAIGTVTGGAAGGTGGTAAGTTIGEALALVGENAGTVAAEAGAMTPSSVATVVPAQTTSILNGGVKGSVDSLLQEVGRVAANAGQKAVGGAVSGAVQNYENPLKGAAMGAAGSFASSAASQMGGTILKGAGGNVFNPAPTRGYSLAGSDSSFNPSQEYSLGSMGSSDGFQRAYNPQAEAFSLGRPSPAMSPPSLGQQFGQGAVGMASRGAGAAARMGVNSMMTPPPAMPEQNPYAQWGVQPYWARNQRM